MSQKFTSNELNRLLDYLYSLQRQGIKVGLEHTRELLKRCGDPQKQFESIHIAGTNGKGSTAAITAKILCGTGKKVGLYTSPHLIKFNERIRIDGKSISNEQIVDFVSTYQKDFNQIQSTFFETTTALAYWYFAKEKIDVAVIETGLGGRLDSTNTINPSLTVITPVALDHTDLLGSTLREIAGEKAGIIKDGVPLITADQSKTVMEVLRSTAKKKNAAMQGIGESDFHIDKIDIGGTSFKLFNEQYTTRLLGSHQAINAALAICTAKAYDNSITDEQLDWGLKTVIWPGRMQKLDDTLPIYYDVAHNPQGIRAMLDTLKALHNRPWMGVIGLKADKELQGIAEILRGAFDRLYVLDAPNTGIMSGNDLHEMLDKHEIPCAGILNPEQVIKIIKNDEQHFNANAIFGSHYFSNAIFNALEIPFDIETI